MTRFLLASLVAGFLAATAPAAERQVPQVMPGDPKAAPAAPPAKPATAAPLATSPTVTSEMVHESIAEGNECCQRLGLLRRLASHWCGYRYAYVDGSACCTTEQCESPVYCTHECGRVRLGHRCRQFGVGRFIDRDGCCGRGRLRAWLCWKPCRERMPCMATPYQSPVRYFFGPAEEPSCGQCADGCGANGCAAGGIGGGRPGLGGRRGGDCAGGAGIGGLGIGGGRGGHCRNREQCDTNGTPFNGNIRFARDAKTVAPPINANKPHDYEGSWHDLRYMKQPESTPPTIVQAGGKR